jgi:hypothetical protein
MSSSARPAVVLRGAIAIPFEPLGSASGSVSSDFAALCSDP